MSLLPKRSPRMTHSPPNGWGCSCFVIGARTIAGAVRVGGKPGNSLPDGWRSPQPKTGTPPGIDKGWDHAPGASVAEMVTSMVQKPVNWDFSLAVAYMRNVPEPNRDAFSRGYRELPSVATEMRLYVERVRDEQNGAAFALKVRVRATADLWARNQSADAGNRKADGPVAQGRSLRFRRGQGCGAAYF